MLFLSRSVRDLSGRDRQVSGLPCRTVFYWDRLVPISFCSCGWVAPYTCDPKAVRESVRRHLGVLAPV